MRPSLTGPLPREGTYWTSADAAARGLDASRLRSLVRCGRLARPARGVYMRPQDAQDAWLVAYAVLEQIGHDGVIGYDTAGALWRIREAPATPVHVVVPHRRALARRPDVVPHHADLVHDDVIRKGGLRLTNPQRTAVDLARTLDRYEALGVLDAALHVRLCTPAVLADELARHGGRPGVAEVRGLLPLADGRAESPMESRTRLIVIESGLPEPEPQYVIRAARARVDLGFPEYRVALEYASAMHHRGAEPVSNDRARDRRIVVAGWLALHVTGSDVLGPPDRMIRECAGLLMGRGWVPSGDFVRRWL